MHESRPALRPTDQLGRIDHTLHGQMVGPVHVGSSSATPGADQNDRRCTGISLPLEKIAAESEDFLLQTYPQHLRHFCRRPLVVASVFVCVNVAVAGITTSIFGGFTEGAKVNLTQDSGIIPAQLLAFAAFYYYLQMPKRFSKTLIELRNNGVFTSDDIRIGCRVSRLSYDSRIRMIPIFGALIVGVLIALVTTLRIFRTPETVYWFDLNHVNSVPLVIGWMLTWLALSGVATSMAVSGAALSSIFAGNKILVHSLHPDKCGGFSPVGKFSFLLTSMALFPGIMIVVFAWTSIENNTLRSDYPLLILEGVLYLVIVPLLFYLPIRGAHKAMVAYRDDLIRETYERYSDEHLSKRNVQDKEGSASINSAVDQMDILKRLAVHESAYPVWPFSFRTRAGVFLNSILPLAFTLIGVVFDNYLNH